MQQYYLEALRAIDLALHEHKHTVAERLERIEMQKVDEARKDPVGSATRSGERDEVPRSEAGAGAVEGSSRRGEGLLPQMRAAMVDS